MTMAIASHEPPAAAVESRPVADADPALEVLRRHGDHPSAFLAYNDATRHHEEPGIDGLIAYRAGRRHVAQLCGPFAPAADRAALLASFRRRAAAGRRRVSAVQLLGDDARLYADHGFAVNQLGSSYSIALEGYTLRGTRFMKVRNKVKRAARQGVTVEELTAAELEDPRVRSQLADVDAAWLGDKGTHAQELAFMIGERDGRGRPHRRIFVARHDGQPAAYVTYSPCFGRRPGWLYDLTRRRPTAPPGTIELLFTTALERMQSEGCPWLHLGLTPFAGLADEHEIAGASSRFVRFAVRQIASRGQALYPAASQEDFKLKWSPQVVEPEYVAFDRRVSAGAVLHLLRLTRTIAL